MGCTQRMITGIEIENLLAFQRLSLPLRPLTLLSGTSSSGKSSVLHIFGMLRQSHTAKTLPSALLLNGVEAELGTGRDVLHSEPMSAEGTGDEVPMRVGLTTDGGSFAWAAMYAADADVIALTEAPDDGAALGVFRPGFQYLRADRIVPAVTYPKSHEAVNVQRSLGSRGEHAPNFLRVHGEGAIACREARHHDAAGMSLLDQTNAWLDSLSPGTSLNVDDVVGTDYVRLSFFRAGTDIKTESQRATNVGFGLTYALPVIIACLMSTPGSLLLVENPEAHLHPKGQAALGTLCALAAAGGGQVLVETHSDHVLNAVRLSVKRSQLTPEQVIIHFFSRTSGVLQPDVETMSVTTEGMIPRWPLGFFDEWDKALDELLG
jgi:predicted ATPase